MLGCWFRCRPLAGVGLLAGGWLLFYVLTRLITDGLVRVHAAGQGYLTDWGSVPVQGIVAGWGTSRLLGCWQRASRWQGLLRGRGGRPTGCESRCRLMSWLVAGQR